LVTASELNEEVLNQAIRKDIETNLDILPSGPKVPNPANLFGSVEMRTLLEQLGGLYSYVVIDSPPVLYFADSLILASGVEVVVIVARANFSSRDLLARAKKKIQEIHGNLVGIVINDIQIKDYKYYNNVYYKQLEQTQVDEDASSVFHLNS
jgi:Mrp family chromosome partitioning ATPase